jgi:ankyrin repeat protein
VAVALRGHVEQGAHRGDRSGGVERSILGGWEPVAVSGSGLCINERDAAEVTSLILAAERGDAEDVRVLLDAGADPCAVSESGWTALHGAEECNCVPAIEMLVEAGADVSASAWSGKTPLALGASGLTKSMA